MLLVLENRQLKKFTGVFNDCQASHCSRFPCKNIPFWWISRKMSYLHHSWRSTLKRLLATLCCPCMLRAWLFFWETCVVFNGREQWCGGTVEAHLWALLLTVAWDCSSYRSMWTLTQDSYRWRLQKKHRSHFQSLFRCRVYIKNPMYLQTKSCGNSSEAHVSYNHVLLHKAPPIKLSLCPL